MPLNTWPVLWSYLPLSMKVTRKCCLNTLAEEEGRQTFQSVKVTSAAAAVWFDEKLEHWSGSVGRVDTKDRRRCLSLLPPFPLYTQYVL